MPNLLHPLVAILCLFRPSHLSPMEFQCAMRISIALLQLRSRHAHVVTGRTLAVDVVTQHLATLCFQAVREL